MFHIRGLKFIAISLLAFLTAASVAHGDWQRPGWPGNGVRTFQLSFNDLELTDRVPNRDMIRLRKEIEDQYGRVDLNQYELVNVQVEAKGQRGSRSEMALVVGTVYSPVQRIRGRDFDYNRPGFGYMRYDFANPNRDSRGVWQIRVRGNVKVDRIVVEVRDLGNGGGGGGGGGWGRPEQITLNGRSCGNGAGACDCVVPGSPYAKSSDKADNLCRELGFQGLADANSFEVVPGPRGALICSGIRNGNSCFTNRNEGNVICSSITCVR